MVKNLSYQSIIINILKENPSRLFNKFSTVNFSDKLITAYGQSLQIKTGYFLEEIIKNFFEDLGAKYLPRRTIPNYDCDQLFQFDNKTILIEQKILDDHDSTKKIGQIMNYLAKKEYLEQHYENVITIMWFINDESHKNRNYYLTKISKNELLYGEEIIPQLEGIFNNNSKCKNIYNFIENEINNFKEERSKENKQINLNDIMLTSKELYNILKYKCYYNDIKKYLFNGNIDLFKLKFQAEKDKHVKLLHLLEEYINYECI